MKRFIVEKDVSIPMRDGIRLKADLWRPDVEQPVATILYRTPYDRAALNPDFLRPQDAVNAGFAAVVQDTRGRFGSEGAWKPLMWDQEGDDGYDSVEWIARQDWSSGPVGMAGPSYLGIAQLMAAARKPPHLKAIAPALTTSRDFELIEMGGGMRLDHLLSWVAFMAVDWMRRQQESGAPLPPDAVKLIVQAALDPRILMDHRPLRDCPIFGLPGFPIGFDELVDPDGGAPIAAEIADIPTLHVGGWYDIFAQASIGMFQRQRDAGRTDAHLIMGCWTHSGSLGQQHGEVNFGVMASAGGSRLADRHIAFFRRYLEGAETALPAVQYFLANANEWRSAEAWPTPDTAILDLELSGTGKQEYDYDPSDPTPTVGGRTLYLGGLAMGPIDQRKLDARHDFVRYVAEACDDPVDLIGPVTANLTVSTSAVDTDFICKLVDVSPDGTILPICEGTLRLRYRNGFDRELPAEPGVPVPIGIPMGHTAWRVLPGHRIGIQIQSANYPHLDPNMNEMSQPGEGAGGTIARNGISDHPGASTIRVTLAGGGRPPIILRPGGTAS